MRKKRISKAVREEAALACHMAAFSTNDRGILDSFRTIRDQIKPFLIDDPAHDLACAAFAEAYRQPWTKTEHGNQDWTLQIAEAEALIRTGWTPTDWSPT